MKQYTTPEQTAKMIELGFEPELRIRIAHLVPSKVKIDHDYNFSIGGLIDILPKSLEKPYNSPLAIEYNGLWRVYYGTQEDYSWEWSIWYEEERNELVDALYDMIVKLKEEGVI